MKNISIIIMSLLHVWSIAVQATNEWHAPFSENLELSEHSHLPTSKGFLPKETALSMSDDITPYLRQLYLEHAHMKFLKDSITSNAVTPENELALIAIITDNIDVITFLLSFPKNTTYTRANVLKVMKSGKTLIHVAAAYGRSEFIPLLAQHLCPYAKDLTGVTAHFEACYQNQPDVIKAIRKTYSLDDSCIRCVEKRWIKRLNTIDYQELAAQIGRANFLSHLKESYCPECDNEVLIDYIRAKQSSNQPLAGFLTITNTCIQESGAHKLAELLQQNPEIEGLRLIANKFDDNHIDILVKIIQESSIKSLTLSNQNFSNEGLILFIKLIANDHLSLSEINVHHCFGNSVIFLEDIQKYDVSFIKKIDFNLLSEGMAQIEITFGSSFE